MRSAFWRITGLLVLGALFASGCGGGTKGPPPHLVPVRGKVVYHDKPVAGTTVQFLPLKEHPEEGSLASAVTDDAGNFTLETYPHGAGARPGTYKVIVLTPIPGARTFPEKYTEGRTTPFQKVEVPEGGKQNLVLTLSD